MSYPSKSILLTMHPQEAMSFITNNNVLSSNSWQWTWQKLSEPLGTLKVWSCLHQGMTPYAGMVMAHGLSVCTGRPWHSWTWCCGHGPTLGTHGKPVMRLAGSHVPVLYSTVQSCLYPPGLRKVEWFPDLGYEEQFGQGPAFLQLCSQASVNANFVS